MRIGFANTLSGRYIVPHWIKVNDDVTFDNVLKYIPAHIIENEKKYQVKRFKVPGKKYIIMQTGSYWSCSCVGFRYHKKCKHLTQFKNEREAA